MATISILQASEKETAFQDLVELLVDSVDNGASVGFLPPLNPGVAAQYWESVFIQLIGSHKDLVVARNDQGKIIGAVQLAYEPRANGQHRAEVQKLFVHSSSRRQGLAARLMDELEQLACTRGLSLLVLDTRQGDAAEQLYEKLGYQKAGQIPAYARSADGELHTSVFFYKQLDPA